jgi:hypothetical protein
MPSQIVIAKPRYIGDGPGAVQSIDPTAAIWIAVVQVEIYAIRLQSYAVPSIMISLILPNLQAQGHADPAQDRRECPIAFAESGRNAASANPLRVL